MREAFRKKGGDRGKMSHHSVGPLLEQGIELRATREIENAALEAVFRAKPPIRKVVDEIVDEITDKVSIEASNEEEAMDMLYRELERYIPEVMRKIYDILR